MDPVTHGLIGATASQSTASLQKLRPAAFTGFISAMLADLDILIANPNDPLLNIEYHRQFTHALIFIPAGALIASCLLWWFLRRQLSYGEIYKYSLLGYATSGITDALTSYGTILLWPFSEHRFSWNIISVFDPLFTLGILILLTYGLYRKKRLLASTALIWIGLYLSFGVYQQQRAQTVAYQFATDNHHHIEQVVVKPSIANQILWGIRYRSEDSLYSAGVHLSPLSETIVYEGEATQLIRWRREFERFKGTTLYEDLQRFEILSKGWLTRHPNKPNVIGDARYAMLPTSATPLWGVEVDTTQPQRHLPFQNFRDTSPEVRKKFLYMLLGKKDTSSAEVPFSDRY